MANKAYKYICVNPQCINKSVVYRKPNALDEGQFKCKACGKSVRRYINLIRRSTA